jgi:putative membrane protein
MTQMMFWDGGHLAFWQLCLMWVGMVAFWALVAWGIYALVTGVSSGSQLGPCDDRPADDSRRIIDERLARGEIDVEDYRRLRDALSSDERRPPVGRPR